jgi:hypothetical protein
MRAILLLVCVSSGCAIGSVGYRVSNMIPEDPGLTSTRYSVRLSAEANDSTWSRMMRVPDEIFVQALRESLVRARTFSEVVTEGEADYALDVRMKELSQPMAGTDITVDLLAQWTLTELATGAVVLDETVPSSSSVSPRTAFSATERVRLATEEAIRLNIAKGLRRIAASDLGR